MVQINIKKALSDYGLSNEEILVYLAVLELGSATVREISLATKIKRTTIYLIAEKLLAKGIMGEYKAKYGTHYTIQSPKNLLTRLEDIKSTMEIVIPQLEAIEKKESYEPNIKFYKGKRGYLTVLNDSLEGYSHEVLYFGSAKELNKIVTEQYVTNRYIPIRLKRKIMFKELVFADKFSQGLKKRDSQELRQTKFLPADYNFDANMMIYADKVAYFTSKRELISVLIESKDIAKMETKKFDLLWDNL